MTRLSPPGSQGVHEPPWDAGAQDIDEAAEHRSVLDPEPVAPWDNDPLLGVGYTRRVSAPKLEDASTVGASTSRRSWVGVEPSLRWVLEDSGEFPDLPGLDQLTPEQVVELGGGVDAATYLVRCPGRDLVVKLKSDGLEAEARALRAWKPYTPRVPEVLGSGTVPSPGERPTKYLILAALKNDAGQLVETAAEYLDRSPASARELGGWWFVSDSSVTG